MNHLNLSHRGKLALTALPLAAALCSQSAYADTIVMNFDSLDTSGGYITGAPVTNYLASYGITASNLTTGSFLAVDSSPYGISSGSWWVAPSSPNMFTLYGPSNGSSFTLNFTNSVSDFSFTRSGFLGAGSTSGTILGDWSATAYNASHVGLGAVGEGMIATYGDIPMQTFTLGYQGISSITFYANAHNFAGVQMPYMDNLTFTTTTPVPEPETYAMLLAGLGLLGFTGRRKKNPAA